MAARASRTVTMLKRKLLSLRHLHELSQLADLASDWLFTLVQPIRSQLACWHNSWQWLQLKSFHPCLQMYNWNGMYVWKHDWLIDRLVDGWGYLCQKYGSHAYYLYIQHQEGGGWILRKLMAYLLEDVFQLFPGGRSKIAKTWSIEVEKGPNTQLITFFIS